MFCVRAAIRGFCVRLVSDSLGGLLTRRLLLSLFFVCNLYEKEVVIPSLRFFLWAVGGGEEPEGGIELLVLCRIRRTVAGESKGEKGVWRGRMNSSASTRNANLAVAYLPSCICVSMLAWDEENRRQ